MKGSSANAFSYTLKDNTKADNYTITKTEGTLTITDNEAALEIKSSTKSWTYDGQTHTDEVYTVTYPLRWVKYMSAVSSRPGVRKVFL